LSLFNQLAAARAQDTTLPNDIRRSLVDELYLPFKSLVVGAVSGALIASSAAIWSHDSAFSVIAVTISFIGVLRIFQTRAYLRRRPSDPIEVAKWERSYAAGAFAFAFTLGLLAFLAVTRSSDIAIQVITSTTAAGYAAGISGRNAGRPILAVFQMLLACLPLVAGLFLAGDGPRSCLGVVIVLFAYGMIDITLSIRRTIVTAMVTTRDKAALADRFEAQASLFDIALNNMSHGLCMFDDQGKLQIWNDRFLEISGISVDRVFVGTSSRELFDESFASIDPDTVQHLPARTEFSKAAAALQAGTLVLTLPDDRTVSLMQRRTAQNGSVVIIEDITERRRYEDRIHKMACYDELTGLLNRRSFRTQVNCALSKARRESTQFAIHLLDLDRFKAVNDTFGHPTGDRLLQLVADRLRVLATDGNSVARLGGDEFVIIQHSLESLEAAGALAHRIVRILEEPFDIEGTHMTIGASIGIALAPDQASDADRLLKCADIALYCAKSDGKNGYRIFMQEMEAATRARHAVEADLRSALVNAEFELLYQPLVDLKGGLIVGCEALIRWKHPRLGYIPPSEFIPVAEETGLIVPIGEWILNAACQEAARWPKEVQVAVNLSPIQFNNRQLCQHVIEALQQSGLPARRLELEITESVTLGGSEATLATMQELRSLGVRLSLDDFGTGYSSLSYLRKYPFDKLKIDRSFVTELSATVESPAIIRAIVGMGKSLGMTIVVEGIETETQLNIVRGEGCDLGQGYYFSRPVSPIALTALFSTEAIWFRKVA